MVLPQMPISPPAVPDPVQIAAASQQALINQQALLMVRTGSTSQNLHVPAMTIILTLIYFPPVSAAALHECLQAQQINMQAMNLAQQQTQEQKLKQEQKQKSDEQRGREEERLWKRRSERRHRTRSPSRSPPTRSPSPPSRYSRKTSFKRSPSRTRRPKPEVFLPLLIYFFLSILCTCHN